MSKVPKSPRHNCYFGCEVKGPLHHFPKLDDIERFNIWKKVLHNETIVKGDIYIYNQLRLCNRHFEPCYISQSNRLTKNSYPTLCLNNDDDEMPINAPTSPDACMEATDQDTEQLIETLLEDDDEMPINAPTSPDACMEATDQDTEQLIETLLEGRCICCLKEGELQNLWEPYVFEGVTEIYGEMLSECYTLTPQSEDNLQSIEMICTCCIKRLRDAFSFRREVMSSAQMLQNYRKKMLLHTVEEEDPLKLTMESQCENIENLNITNVKKKQSNENSSAGLFQIKCFNRPKKFIGMNNKCQLNQKTNKNRVKIKTCEFCGKNFNRFQNYVTHIKTIHGNQKSFKYKDSGKKFLIKHELSKLKIQHTL